jgi:methylenetetrahydrofolate dehydrogenase (NADP+)/methenyltetrahydrofolate cyclohydrolase
VSFWDDTIWLSRRFGNGFVDQQDGNTITNRVGAAAFATLQSLPFILQYEGFLTGRADQNVEQVLRNHGNGFYAIELSAVSYQLSAPGFPLSALRSYCQLIAESRELGYDKFSRLTANLEANFMAGTILDGNKIAAEIRAEVASEVKSMAEAGMRPGLAVVLVGHNPASEIYVRGKVKSCEEVGIYSEKLAPPETISTEQLLELVLQLNRREEIDGILVQLPLPPQVDSKKILMAVDPARDVDGFHPVNVGFLSTQRPGLVPCTPAGIMEILKRSNISVAGQEVVVVGRSDIVGKPVAMLLINANATVTVCHSRTRDLPGVCRRADILVAAIGRAGMITRDFVKLGATVIDVGMNKVTDQAEFESLFSGNARREESFRTKGSTLVGDVHPTVAEVAGAITPVPGGVGPLTIAMLMANTVKAAKMRRGSRVPALAAEHA